MGNKSKWKLIWRLPQVLPTSTSPDAKWGIVSMGISFVLFFIASAVAFWAMQVSLEGGRVMFPSSGLPWIFFIAAILSAVAAFVVAVYILMIGLPWYLKSGSVKSESQAVVELVEELNRKVDALSTSLGNKIDSLASEIREDRNERKRNGPRYWNSL